MSKRFYPDVRPGQLWRDRDRRMMSGNRKVRVVKTERDGERVSVYYREDYGTGMVSREFRSAYDRFQRSFDLIQGVEP
jgi:hypothetical protein